MRALLLFCLVSLTVTGTHAQSAADLVAKGLQKLEMGHNEEALKYYNQAIQNDPTYMDAYVKRAFVHSIMKDYTSAIADYDAIIASNPNLPHTYVSRGSAYNKLEKYEEALKDFNKALELDPGNAEAYNNRGWSKKGLGDKEGACSDWKASKKLGNEEAKIILKNNQC